MGGVGSFVSLLNRKGAKDAKVVFLGCKKSIVSADTRRSQCLSWRALRLERSGRLSCRGSYSFEPQRREGR